MKNQKNIFTKSILLMFLVLVFSVSMTSCASSRPVYSKSASMDNYHKKLKKHYEKKQNAQKFRAALATLKF